MKAGDLTAAIDAVIATNPELLKLKRSEIAQAVSALIRRLAICGNNGWRRK